MTRRALQQVNNSGSNHRPNLHAKLVDFDELETLEQEEKKKRRWGWMVLLIGFGGFLLWGSFAPLDSGIPLDGNLRVFGDTKTIEHPFGGTVDKIAVQEGQEVAAGDVLIELNTTQFAGEREVLRTQWIGLAAVQSRLMAELNNDRDIKFPKWFSDNSEDPRVVSAIRLQTSLFETRAQGQGSELAAIQENISALSKSLKDLNDGLSSRKEQLAAYEKRLEGIRAMADAGYIPSNRLLEAQADQAQLISGISDDTARIAQLQGDLAEAKLRLQNTKSKFSEDAQGRLTDVDNRVSELQERLATADYRADKDIIRSPVKGIVTNLRVNTEGAVVRPAEPIMDVVPDGVRLEVEAQLGVDQVDRVQPGMEVELLFQSLSAAQTPRVPGTLRTVSADALVNEQTGMRYYTVKISMADDYSEFLKDFKIQPGMPVSAFIKGGERTLMVYLFKPLLDRLHTGLTEE